MLKSLNIPLLKVWLYNEISENLDMSYRHNLIREKIEYRENLILKLKPIIKESHSDAKFRLREFLRDDLDPLDDWDEDIDPAEGYPERLDLTTLKGYFGEIFSGIVAENFHPFGEKNWRVPVFSFRFHQTAFDQLETYRQTGQMKKATYGRTGDDCVAFVMDGEKITKILFLEAKCTSRHYSSMIEDAHTKISSKNLKPVEIMRLIEILKSYKKSTEAQKWIDALRDLYRSKTGFERYDCVSYLCGQAPKRPIDRLSWISRDEPHSNYVGNRSFEAVEIQLSSVDKIVSQLYGKEG